MDEGLGNLANFELDMIKVISAADIKLSCQLHMPLQID